MKTLIPGHRYELANFEKQELPGQVLQFIQKENLPPAAADADGKSQPGVFVTVSDGTTNEEVLKMLIDRLENLNAKFPSPFNHDAIEHCKMALKRLEERTADRVSRGVEGTPKA